METYEAILTRRSIRKFKNEPISEELTEKILKAGMYAPSSLNKQPWHFVVINEREKLDTVTNIHPHAEMIKQAPLAVLICGDTDIEPVRELNAINCSAVTQNILLAAHDSGLGGVWLGIFPRGERMKKFREMFGLPVHVLPISMVVLGYPAEEKVMPNRYIAERVHRNNW